MEEINTQKRIQASEDTTNEDLRVSEAGFARQVEVTPLLMQHVNCAFITPATQLSFCIILTTQQAIYDETKQTT
jgi:hypothetical protein